MYLFCHLDAKQNQAPKSSMESYIKSNLFSPCYEKVLLPRVNSKNLDSCTFLIDRKHHINVTEWENIT